MFTFSHDTKYEFQINLEINVDFMQVCTNSLIIYFVIKEIHRIKVQKEPLLKL